jgi:hypothetical protein
MNAANECPDEELVIGSPYRVQTLAEASKQACKAFNKKKALLRDLRKALSLVSAAFVKERFGRDLPADFGELNLVDIDKLLKLLRQPSAQRKKMPAKSKNLIKAKAQKCSAENFEDSKVIADAPQEGRAHEIVAVGGAPESLVSLQDFQVALKASYGDKCDGDEKREDDDVEDAGE